MGPDKKKLGETISLDLQGAYKIVKSQDLALNSRVWLPNNERVGSSVPRAYCTVDNFHLLAYLGSRIHM